MSVLDSIQKQAALIKDAKAREALAAQFEQMARDLKAVPTKAASFGEILGSVRKTKADRFARAERFGAAMRADQMSQAATDLRASGWSMKGTGKEDPQVWGMKGKPGLELSISGNTFQIKQSGDVLQPKTDLALMKNYLSPVGSNSKTNK